MQTKIAETFASAVGSGKMIHCITNPISITQCANAVLALGCRPIMAEHPLEVGEITSSADALLLNLGNVTDARMRSMKISAKAAHKNNIPFVLDAVGAACSELRRNLVLKLIRRYSPAVIKGNYSEIYALHEASYRSRGVDADASLDLERTSGAAVGLAMRYDCTVMASGKNDIVTDGKSCFIVKNGTPRLSCITGTGCMLGAVTAAMLTGGEPFFAAMTGCAVMGISGELAESAEGSGAFASALMDNLSLFKGESFNKIKTEEILWIKK